MHSLLWFGPTDCLYYRSFSFLQTENWLIARWNIYFILNIRRLLLLIWHLDWLNLEVNLSILWHSLPLVNYNLSDKIIVREKIWPLSDNLFVSNFTVFLIIFHYSFTYIWYKWASLKGVCKFFWVWNFLLFGGIVNIELFTEPVFKIIHSCLRFKVLYF